MTWLFLFCATVGGTILVCQLALTLLGFLDLGGDLPDHPTDVDFGSGDVSGHGDMSGHADLDGDGLTDGHGHGHTSSDWLFGVISFRTLVAAITFFGLAGMTARSAEMNPPAQLLIAIGAGIAAMYGVYFLMRQVYKLSQDSTIRIKRAIGKTGTVYLPIPAAHGGAGKVQLVLQQRLMEYEAVTSHGQKLPGGAKIVVVGVVGSETLEVEPVDIPTEQSAQVAQSA
jgi:membrane protein implicated in regulation of membrane protease activity